MNFDTSMEYCTKSINLKTSVRQHIHSFLREVGTIIALFFHLIPFFLSKTVIFDDDLHVMFWFVTSDN